MSRGGCQRIHVKVQVSTNELTIKVVPESGCASSQAALQTLARSFAHLP